MRDYPKKSREILYDFLDRMAKHEKKEMELLASKWKVVATSLEGLIQKLAERQDLSPNQLFQTELYKQFLKESKQKVKMYNNYVAGKIEEGQELFGRWGIESTQEVIGLQVKLFQKLPVSAINVMIGKTQDGSALDTILNRSYKPYVEQIKNSLIKGIALGKNPREVAREITKNSTVPLWKSLRLARTEQLGTFREASRLSMIKSGVVKEWEWLIENDEIVCEFCESQNGKRFPLTEGMNTHPNCRCAELPIVG